MSYGWTWHDVDPMTLAEVSEALRYLEKHPPVHEIAAAYFPLERKPVETEAPVLGRRRKKPGGT